MHLGVKAWQFGLIVARAGYQDPELDLCPRGYFLLESRPAVQPMTRGTPTGFRSAEMGV